MKRTRDTEAPATSSPESELQAAREDSQVDKKTTSEDESAEGKVAPLRICVFCGSGFGAREVYAETARALGAELARRGIELVWGGSNSGLMGVVADGVLDGGGRCVGVLPESLKHRELAHPRASELHVVKSMHERKALMASLANAFIAIPGGFGTLDEFFEIITWNSLGIQSKPCGILNVAGYYDKLLAFMDHAVEEQFVKPQTRARVLVEGNACSLVDRILESLTPPKL